MLSNENQVIKVAGDFLTLAGSNNKFAFYGEMGVGKTTFIKGICHNLSVIDEVTSPSFAIINVYHTSKVGMIYHFDFYRIKKIEELFDFGYEEYFYSDAYCFIEWPEKVESVLPENFLNVEINTDRSGVRRIIF